MAKIISIHAARRGTGKSTIAANLATMFATSGQRVGLIDSDVHEPALHRMFGLEDGRITTSLNMFLWGQCVISETAYDVTPTIIPPKHGKIFLIPFVVRPNEIDYDISLLSDSFQLLISSLNLDVLLIDAAPGLDQAALPSLAFSDTQVTVLRLDHQDYQGTGVSIDVSAELGVPDRLLIVNHVPIQFETAAVRQQVEEAYHCHVIAVLPHADELETTKGGIFVVQYPEHMITNELKQAATVLAH